MIISSGPPVWSHNGIVCTGETYKNVNAIRDACGVRIYDIPATPQKIQAALAATQK